MSIIEDNLKKFNIILPDPKGPVGAYAASKIVGNLLFISINYIVLYGKANASKNKTN